MAKLVTIILSNASPRVGQRIAGQVAVNSTDANPATITDVNIYATQLPAGVIINKTNPQVAGGGAGGASATAPTGVFTVNQNATLYFPFEVIGIGPQTPGASAVATQLNAVVTFSDGTVVANSNAPVLGTITPSNSGGSLATGTYLLKVTALDASGGETLASAETAGQAITGPSGQITVNLTLIPGAVKYRVYYTTGGSGTEGNYMEYTQTTSPLNFTTTSGNVTHAVPSADTFKHLNVSPLLLTAQ